MRSYSHHSPSIHCAGQPCSLPTQLFIPIVSDSHWRLPLLCNPDYSLEVLLWEVGALRLNPLRLREKLHMWPRTGMLFALVSIHVFRRGCPAPGKNVSSSLLYLVLSVLPFSTWFTREKNTDLLFSLNLMSGQLCVSWPERWSPVTCCPGQFRPMPWICQ